jgi:hypothetical protein
LKAQRYGRQQESDSDGCSRKIPAFKSARYSAHVREQHDWTEEIDSETSNIKQREITFRSHKIQNDLRHATKTLHAPNSQQGIPEPGNRIPRSPRAPRNKLHQSNQQWERRYTRN